MLSAERCLRRRLRTHHGRWSGPTRAAQLPGTRGRCGQRRADPGPAPEAARRAGACQHGPDRRPADSPRQRPAAPVPLPAARD